VVVGVGVNVNATVHLDEERDPEEWPVGPRSLNELAGGPVALQPLLLDLVSRLIDRLGAGLTGDAVDEYRSRCHTLGKRVAFTEGGMRLTGTAVDVIPEGGALLVRLEDGRIVEVSAGEVRHLRELQG
jgi:BirA family biotin operon repressor/biotin-[acetyl-CoA-carboxylase] ligase